MKSFYSYDILEGNIIKIKDVQKYVYRRNKPERTYRRYSTFGLEMIVNCGLTI